MKIKNNIVFLDYDGVVNTIIWDKDGKCGFNYPSDGKVNNYQAIMWLNELCKKTHAKIVVSSTWRYCCEDVSYQDCLYNGGLDKNIEIIGCTDVIEDQTRTEEIKTYLENHPEIENYVILDDEKVDDDHFVQCCHGHGFGIEEFYEAMNILRNNHKNKED